MARMSANAWLPHAPRVTNARVRLFCLPYAGGGAAVYRPWVKVVPAEVQICAVQLPGRESRLMEPPFTRMDALIPALVAAIREHLDRPFAIFGHSMGALVGFELTRALRRANLSMPAHLFLSAHRAPHLPDRRPHIHQLNEADFRQALRELEGTPEEVLENRELMDLIEPTLRADFELCEVYQPAREAPLDVPMTIFGGIADPNVDEAELDAWREYTRAPVRVQMFRGNHLFLHQSQREVTEEVVRMLRSA
jgi:medium-chain acyl-[acyl-carrier-protein] hydrolase